MKTLARVVSQVGNPLVFTTATVVIVTTTQLAPSRAWAIVATLFLAVIMPTAVVLIAGVRSGQWQDSDVSVRTERKKFYPIAILISGIGLLATWLIRAPGFILKGGLVTLGLFVVAALINLRLKISLHSLFAFFCAVILLRVHVLSGVIAMILAVFVVWSRLALGRHTLAECGAGLTLGAAGGFVVAWLPL